MVILSREDLSEATDLVKLIKTRARGIEDERTRLVKPFNDGVKQISARFKQVLEPLTLRSATSSYREFRKEIELPIECGRRGAGRAPRSLSIPSSLAH